jgi:SnoaL-like domain
MEESAAVRDGLLAFYQRFSSGDPEAFAAGIADVPGVSVIGTAPGEGHTERGDWISTYETMMAGEMKGTRLEGTDPRGFAEGSLGFATDDAAFVLPEGSRLPARLTAVLREGERGWQVVHLHVSVGVPDEDAVVSAAT